MVCCCGVQNALYTEVQESLELGLKRHSFTDFCNVGFWRRVAKAVRRQGEHLVFRGGFRT